MKKDKGCLNTDKELYREVPNDAYSNSLFITEGGSIGINVAGTVVVQPIRDWMACALFVKNNNYDINCESERIIYIKEAIKNGTFEEKVIPILKVKK